MVSCDPGCASRLTCGKFSMGELFMVAAQGRRCTAGGTAVVTTGPTAS